MAGCDILLTTGDRVLQTDGVSNLLLAACVETPEVTGGGAGTIQRFPRKWWDSYKEPKKRKPVIDYAQSVAKAFAKAKAKDAEKLAERAEVLERLIAESSFKLAYLEDAAARLRVAAIKAAEAETMRLREEQMAVAAELAHLLEIELRDEEEATLLLLMN